MTDKEFAEKYLAQEKKLKAEAESEITDAEKAALEAEKELLSYIEEVGNYAYDKGSDLAEYYYNSQKNRIFSNFISAKGKLGALKREIALHTREIEYCLRVINPT